MSIGFWILGSLWISLQASAEKLEYVGRCDLAAPPLVIGLDGDPRTLVRCQLHDGVPYLSLGQKVHLNVGSQVYHVREKWLGLSESCTGALRAFQEFPEIQLVDPESKAPLQVQWDQDYKRITVQLGLRRDACRGTIRI